MSNAMSFRIMGVDRATSEDVRQVVSASSVEEARKNAELSGIMVTQVDVITEPGGGDADLQFDDDAPIAETLFDDAFDDLPAASRHVIAERNPHAHAIIENAKSIAERQASATSASVDMLLSDSVDLDKPEEKPEGTWARKSPYRGIARWLYNWYGLVMLWMVLGPATLGAAMFMVYRANGDAIMQGEIDPVAGVLLVEAVFTLCYLYAASRVRHRLQRDPAAAATSLQRLLIAMVVLAVGQIGVAMALERSFVLPWPLDVYLLGWLGARMIMLVLAMPLRGKRLDDFTRLLRHANEFGLPVRFFEKQPLIGRMPRPPYDPDSKVRIDPAEKHTRLAPSSFLRHSSLGTLVLPADITVGHDPTQLSAPRLTPPEAPEAPKSSVSYGGMLGAAFVCALVLGVSAKLFLDASRFTIDLQPAVAQAEIFTPQPLVETPEPAAAQPEPDPEPTADDLVAKAVGHFNAGSFTLAKRYYEQAAKLDPMNARALLGIASCHQRLGQTHDAEAAFQLAADRAPNDASVHYFRGMFYLHDMQNPGRAAHYLNQAVDVRPDFYLGYIELGRLYARQRKFTDARDVFRSAIAVDPKTERAYTELGLVFIAMDKPALAVETMEDAVAIAPMNARVHLVLGMAHLYSGSIEQARAEHDTLKALDPTRAASLQGLIRVEVARLTEAKRKATAPRE